MGRMRIKKKDTVIPFRQTVGYRFSLLTGSIIIFLVALYVTITAFRAGGTVLLIGSSLLTIAAAVAVFYNLDHMRDVKVPDSTLKRIKRR